MCSSDLADHRQEPAVDQRKWIFGGFGKGALESLEPTTEGECMTVSAEKTKFGRNDTVLEAAGIAVTMDSER